MPSIYQLKPAFQQRLRPVVERLVQRGKTANQVTVAAVLLSAAVSALIVIAAPTPDATLLIVPLALFARMALNAIDGMMAREHGMKTSLGAILNEVGDVVSDALLYLPFALFSGVSAALVTSVVTAGLIAEFTGLVPATLGASRRYDGPFGKSDRAAFFGVVALLLGFGVEPGRWLTILLVIGLALSVVTSVNRARAGLKELAR